MSPRYDIQLCVPLGARCADWFMEFDVRTHGRVLLLQGELDQAALFGLLERARMLRLDLMDVRRSRSAPRRGA
jgi:hypothetical protein